MALMMDEQEQQPKSKITNGLSLFEEDLHPTCMQMSMMNLFYFYFIHSFHFLGCMHHFHVSIYGLQRNMSGSISLMTSLMCRPYMSNPLNNKYSDDMERVTDINTERMVKPSQLFWEKNIINSFIPCISCQDKAVCCGVATNIWPEHEHRSYLFIRPAWMHTLLFCTCTLFPKAKYIMASRDLKEGGAPIFHRTTFIVQIWAPL